MTKIYYTGENSKFGGSRDFGKKSIEDLLKEAIDVNLQGKGHIDTLLLSSVHPELLTSVSRRKLLRKAKKYISGQGYDVGDVVFYHNNGFIRDSDLAASSQGGALVNEGVRRIREGNSSVALLSLEHMHFDGQEIKRNVWEERKAKSLTSLIDEEALKYGITMAQYGAMLRNLAVASVSKAYQKKVEATLRIIFGSSRNNAKNNASAHLKQGFKGDDYVKDYQDAIKGGSLAEPYTDRAVCPTSTGEAFSILQTTAPQEDMVTVLTGIANGAETRKVALRDNPASFQASRQAFADAYKMAGINFKDIDYAELHNAFDVIALIEMIAGGFFDKLEDIELDRKTGYMMISYDGETRKVPLNLSGGPMCSHAIAATSHRTLNELSLQLKDAAKDGKGKHGVVSGVGGPGVYNHAITAYTGPRDEIETSTVGDNVYAAPARTKKQIKALDAEREYHKFGEGDEVKVVTMTAIDERIDDKNTRKLYKAIIQDIEDPSKRNFALSYDEIAIGEVLTLERKRMKINDTRRTLNYVSKAA